MICTPYLKRFNVDGGTLYVFPSVGKDLTRTLVSSDYEFKFSHFACLNIPNIYTGKYTDGADKGLYLQTLAPNGWIANTGNLSKAITENIQNYVMNFETAILNGDGDNDEYDSDILTTVSEKVFFNWLHKVGAINFTEDGMEEDYSSYADRTVQYIGNIDVMNTVEIDGDTFEEIYIHIPSTVGASSKIYFRNGELTDDKNYLNKTYSIGGDGEYLVGRRAGVQNPYDASISVVPFVDVDNGINCYTGDIGHTIDFRDSSYTDGISDMNSKSLEDFEFNTILIYYDIYQKTNQANVKRVATNLYGVLFLDNVRTESNVNYMQRYLKKRETVYGSGNSYVLKIDLKVRAIGDTNVTEYVKFVDPNDTAAMSLYMKALTQLQNCIDIFYTQRTKIADISSRLEVLENLLMGIDSVESLRADVKRLYDMYDANMTVDTKSLLGLIDANAKKLDNIMNGGKDLKLQYDTDVLQPGTGIGMQKSLNKVIISSEQRYSINTIIDNRYDNDVEINQDHTIKTTDEVKDCTIKLKPGENFAVIYMTDTGNSDSNLNITVDSSDYNWEIGQSLKIYLMCEGGSLVFENDEMLGLKIKPTSNTLLSIPGHEVEGNNLIEIVCINDEKFIYLIK